MIVETEREKEVIRDAEEDEEGEEEEEGKEGGEEGDVGEVLSDEEEEEVEVSGVTDDDVEGVVVGGSEVVVGVV